MSYRVFFTFASFLLTINYCHASYDESFKPECVFHHDNSTYGCIGITESFPNKAFGEFNLDCVLCFFAEFTNKVFPVKNNLKSLNLTNTYIMSIRGHAFENFNKLQYLHLEDNKIGKIDRDAFNGLVHLYEIDLSRNHLEELDDGFANQMQTYTLALSDNRIERIKEDNFLGAMNVLNLYLSRNRIKDIDANAFKHFPLLEILHLEDNNLCHLALGLFRHNKELKVLNLAGNKLTRLLPGTFSGLRGLLSLNLTANGFAHLDVAMLTPLNRMSSLHIARNDMQFLNYDYIGRNFPTLRYLTIDDNIWACDYLLNMVAHLQTKNIDLASYGYPRYDVTNVNGVACYHGVQRMGQTTFETFMKYVVMDSVNQTSC